MFWGPSGGKPALAQGPSITLLLERLRNAKLQGDRREILQELKVNAACWLQVAVTPRFHALCARLHPAGVRKHSST